MVRDAWTFYLATVSVISVLKIKFKNQLTTR